MGNKWCTININADKLYYKHREEEEEEEEEGEKLLSSIV